MSVLSVYTYMLHPYCIVNVRFNLTFTVSIGLKIGERGKGKGNGNREILFCALT